MTGRGAGSGGSAALVASKRLSDTKMKGNPPLPPPGRGMEIRVIVRSPVRRLPETLAEQLPSREGLGVGNSR